MLAAVLASSPAPMPAPLNHFFVVPDAETFAAMKASPFLREHFGVFEERTTVRNDTSYTGIYFYGRNTYFEFLPPEAARPAGSAGVAFGLESEGASAALERRFARVLTQPVRNFVVTRRLGAEDVPWFRMVGVDSKPDAPFATWSMEYDPAFLARWRPELPPASRAITRANVLSRYAEALGQAASRDARWLRDVTGLTLALDDAERAAFLPQLEAYGYAPVTKEGVTIARGTALTLTIRPATASEHGIVEAVFAVKDGVAAIREMRFGRSVLTFAGDGTARWRFSEAPAPLQATFIGNMSLHITDGETSLLTDFPYQSGYSGYQRWDPSLVPATRNALCLITHNHRDHFARELFEPMGARVLGPADVTRGFETRALTMSPRVAYRDLVVEPIRTPHANLEHYSYVVSWKGQRLFFSGDTDDPTALLAARDLDAAFVSPWLLARARKSGGRIDARRVVVYHQQDGEDVPDDFGRVLLKQGETLRLP
jgi:hypothetical protein